MIALAIIAASGGRAPAWFETRSAPPSDGTFSIPFDLDPEPVAVEELEEGLVHEPLDALGAAPVVEGALGLDRRHELGVRRSAGTSSFESARVGEWAAAAGHQPVIAPAEALETVAAYLAMTPEGNAGSGAS